MSTHDGHDHHGPTSFLTKYVFSTDHKVISLQFLFSSLLFVILGALFALGVRYQLAWPNQDVPYKLIMPGKMTAEAPEQNIALWPNGGEVTLTEDIQGVPKGATARVSFPDGYAVTIPAHSIVMVDGNVPQNLAKPVDGFVDASAVMADYNYANQDVRAVIGTQVRVPTASGERIYTLNGRELLITGSTGSATSTISREPLSLPLRREATVVTLDVPTQSVHVDDDKTVAVTATTIDSAIASQVKYTKDSLTSDAYLQLFTMHASIMIFFVIIPTLVGFFGNWAIPLMIGAKDMAFPKLNMLSFWLSFPAGIIMLISFWTMNGPAGGGWTMYPPLAEKAFSSQIGTTLWVVGVGLVGFSSVVGALNYITTIINMRAPGMNMFRMPLTVWSLFITSMLSLLGTPVLTAAMVLLTFDRHLGTSFFLPQGGGQVLLFQHLFWFYSHPAVYIMILPSMGVASDVLSTFSRKPIFGYKPMIFAMATITGLGFIVWGHHMFQSGMNPVLGTTFMASTIMIAVPSAIKTFNWLGTIWGGDIRFTPAMLNAIGFVSMFVIGGLSGIFMASTPIDIQIHDTYFIVAHIHYVLFGGAIFGIFAAIYYWWPKIFGINLDQRWGVIHFIMTIIAFNGTFFLMHILGLGGHPRRYASIMEYPTLQHLQPLNVIMTLWAMSLGAAQIPFFYNLWRSMPRKLARAMTAFFITMLFAPMVIGIAYWTKADGHALHEAFSFFERLVDTSGDAATWSTLGKSVGIICSLAAVIGCTIWFLATLPFGGKVASVCTLIPLCVYAIALALGGDMTMPELPSNATPVRETGHLFHVIFWSPLTRDIFIALGWGVLFGAVVTAGVFLVWFVGGLLKVPKALDKAMWLLFLPLFLSPFVFKQDMFVRMGMPAMFELRWLICLLLVVPALAYLLIKRPKDRYGEAVGANPWHANSLEWATTSPPPHLNFDEIPTVYRGPYEYSSPVVEEDYLPQPKQLPAGVVEPTGH
jgi:cytochrome c oxidase subunit 1